MLKSGPTLLAAVLTTLFTACASFGAHVQRDDAVWTAMIARLRADPAISDHPVEALRFHRKIRSRSVLPQVGYYWGMFHSPLWSHRIVTVLAARQGREIVIIDSEDDWERLYLSGDWRPRNAAEAVAACTEFVTSTRFWRGRAVRVVNPQSRLPLNVIWHDRVRAFATPPSAYRADAQWRASVTAIEPGKTLRFECELADQRASYSVTDSVMGPGFAR